MTFDLFTQPPNPTGEELKELGMQRAVEHADKKIEQWSTRAYNQFVEYIKMVDEFKTEDVRHYAEQNGLEPAPSNRAWGMVARRMAMANLIMKAGHVRVNNPKAHQAFATLWRVVK